MATDLLDETQRKIEARLEELRPLVAEYARLEAAAAALKALPAVDVGATDPASGVPARADARGRTGSKGGGRRGRPKGSGRRRDEALALVRAHPGITVAQIAEQMGIDRNYLYRVLPRLANDGLVVRNGHGWHLAPGS